MLYIHNEYCKKLWHSGNQSIITYIIILIQKVIFRSVYKIIKILNTSTKLFFPWNIYIDLAILLHLYLQYINFWVICSMQLILQKFLSRIIFGIHIKMQSFRDCKTCEKLKVDNDKMWNSRNSGKYISVPEKFATRTGEHVLRTFHIFRVYRFSINACFAYFTRIIYLLWVERFICVVRK